MITDHDLAQTLAALQELLPLGKRLTDHALVLACALFPLKAKAELSREQLTYAVQQRILDPEPAADQAITQQLLRYLYPLSNSQPNLEQGLRRDLPDRMANPQRFHPLAADAAARPAAEVLEEHHLLAPVADGAMEQLTLVAKPLVLAARAAKEDHTAPNTLNQREQELACLLAAGVVIGRWTLEAIDRPSSFWPRQRPWRNLAREWITAHPNGWAAMHTAADLAQQGASRSEDAESHAAQPEGAFPGLIDRSDGVIALDLLQPTA